MNLIPLKKISIITDKALEEYLIGDIKKCGAKGYNREEITGEGIQKITMSDTQVKKIRIESIVSSSTAERIVDLLSDKYLNKYSVIFYLSDVCVLRGERFL